MARLIASFFGTGLILGRFRSNDMGSGTVGSLFALPIVWLLYPFGPWAQVGAFVVATAAALISARPFATDHGDPGWVVIDEVAGTFLATIGLGLVPAIVAWFVFRVADIWKHLFPGVAAAETRLPGSLGVTADDLVAGLYGLAAGWLVQSLL